MRVFVVLIPRLYFDGNISRLSDVHITSSWGALRKCALDIGSRQIKSHDRSQIYNHTDHHHVEVVIIAPHQLFVLVTVAVHEIPGLHLNTSEVLRIKLEEHVRRDTVCSRRNILFEIPHDMHTFNFGPVLDTFNSKSLIREKIISRLPSPGYKQFFVFVMRNSFHV